MKQFLIIFLMLVLLSAGSSVYAADRDPPLVVDEMATLIGSKSNWVWHANEQLLLLCFKIDNVKEALCTAVPHQYRVTDIRSTQPTLVVPNGSDIPM